MTFRYMLTLSWHIFHSTEIYFLLKYSISLYVFNYKKNLSYLFVGKNVVQYKGIC